MSKKSNLLPDIKVNLRIEDKQGNLHVKIKNGDANTLERVAKKYCG